MSEEEQQEYTSSGRDQHVWRARFFTRFQRYKTLLLSKWWVPVVCLVLGVVGMLVVHKFQKPVFASVGRMIVSIKLSLPEGSVYTEELSNFLGTQSALMQSDVVLQRAYKRSGGGATNAFGEPVFPDIKVKVQPKTSIFVLEATGDEPVSTRNFLQAAMEEYVNLKREMRSQTSDTTLAGLTSEVMRMQKELARQDEELLEFQKTNSVVLQQDQGNSAVDYLARLNQQIAALKLEYDLLETLTLEQNLERQQELTKSVPLSANPLDKTGRDRIDTDYLRAKQQILLLKAEQENLSRYLRPKHPRMIAMAEDVMRRERLLDIYKQQSSDQLSSRKDSLALQIKTLEKEVSAWDKKTLEIQRKTAEYQKFKANMQRTQALYDRLLATMQALDVNKDISPESVTIMENASMPKMESRLPIRLLMGAVLGFGLGVLILLVVDRLDDRMSSFGELQDVFDETVLAQIPREKAAIKKSGHPLVTESDAPHSFVEAYRNLRSSILYMGESGKQPKTLLVTSSVPAEGKSLTSANLAAILASSGARVLLIDADMRKGTAHEQLGVPSGPGLSEVFTRDLPFEEAVLKTSVANLWILPRGEVSHRASEMFLTPATLALLKKAQANYDYVVIDTAPVMAADDVTSLAPHADAAIFVVRAEHTSARVARASLDLLYQRRVNVIGLVFNSVRPNSVDYYYYKYHDYYGSYPEGKSHKEKQKVES